MNTVVSESGLTINKMPTASINFLRGLREIHVDIRSGVSFVFSTFSISFDVAYCCLVQIKRVGKSYDDIGCQTYSKMGGVKLCCNCNWVPTGSINFVRRRRGIHVDIRSGVSFVFSTF
jgi:hypothetical protein